MNTFEERDQECARLIGSLTASFDRLGQAYAERHDMHQTDFRALLLIAARSEGRVAMTAGELASALGLSSGAVTYLVERLTLAGHVRRQVDAYDRRKVRLVATPQGHDIVRGHSVPVCGAIRRALDDAGENALEIVHQVISGVTAGLDDSTAEMLADPAAHRLAS